MKCPNVKNMLCHMIDTAGEDKMPCISCIHYIQTEQKDIPETSFIVRLIDNIKEYISFYQVVKWPSDHKRVYKYIPGNPMKDPSAFHIIYKWSLWIGRIEIRKFLNDHEMKKALEIYVKRES